MTLKFAKPKREKKGKKPATVAEKLFMERVVYLPCVVSGVWSHHITLHHVRKNNEPRNHYKVLPIEGYFHLATVGGKNSFHGNKKEWEKRHGTQESLLIKVYELLLADGGLPAPAMEIYTTLKEKEGDGSCG